MEIILSSLIGIFVFCYFRISFKSFGLGVLVTYVFLNHQATVHNYFSEAKALVSKLKSGHPIVQSAFSNPLNQNEK